MHRSLVAGLLLAGTFALALAWPASQASAQQKQQPPAAQPSAAQLQIARDVVDVSGATRAFDTVIPAVLQQTFAMFLQQNPDLQKPLMETISALRPELEKRRGEILEIIANGYARRFTEAELKDLLAFYRSNTGKKFVAEIPAVLEESFERTKEWGGKLSEEIVIKVRAEMKKRGHAL
jgi:hypothetical protein